MASKSEINTASAATTKWLKARQKKHLLMVQKSVKLLEADILDNLHILQTSSTGQLAGIKVNLAQAQKLNRKITGLFGTQYDAKMQRVVADFNSATAAITTNFATIGEAARFTSIDQTMMKVLRDGYYSDYLGISGAAQQRVQQAVYNNVIAGGQFQSLVNEINGALVGTAAKAVTGRSLAQYSRLYARDMIMNYHNDVTLSKAADLGMDLFTYIGTIMSKSRRFCRQRVGNNYTKKQINSWAFKWKGKSGPAMTHRGGYNCRHHWQPVRKEWLPDEDQKLINSLSVLDKDGIPKKRI